MRWSHFLSVTTSGPTVYPSSPLSTPSQHRAPGGDRGPQYPLLVVRAGAQPPGGGGRPPVSLHAHLYWHSGEDNGPRRIQSKIHDPEEEGATARTTRTS